ncbi:MAG: hypothetical protein C0425_07815 [Chlorobiaceae bacterium]|nr:hypothetical protein [Chlorobiaceae bacterium]MBA4310228.1 hypothetical protein [Chlorobiaceae bacterium]
MSNEKKYYSEILNKLKRLENRELSVSALTGIQFYLIGSALLFLLISLLESIFYFPILVRTILFSSWFVLSFCAIVYYFILPLVKQIIPIVKTDYQNIAVKVGSFFPTVKDDLINAMQLVSIENKKLYSNKLIDAAFFNTYNKVKDFKFESVVTFDKTLKLLFISIPILLFSIALVTMVPSLQAASFRMINYNLEFVPPQKFKFVVEPGDASVSKGMNLPLFVSTIGTKPEKVLLMFRDISQTNYESVTLAKDSNGNFQHELKSIQRKTFYYLTAEGINSEEYVIEVDDPLIIKSMELVVTPPAYSGLQSFAQKDNGNISALFGSKINFEIIFNKELKDAHILFNDSSKVNLKTSSNFADGGFTLKQETDYKIITRDLDGSENLSPITYNIKIFFDSNPQIEIIEPNKNVNLNEDQRLPLSVKISDDFGFSKLTLNYRLSASQFDFVQEKFTTLEIPISKTTKEELVNHVWNLSNLNLATNDVITYYLEIFDNDNISGPKSTRTSEFNVRLPSLDELFSQTESDQEKIEQQLTETLKEAEELKNNLEKISQELKQDRREISWEEKEKIEKSLEQFEQLQSKVDELSKKIDESKRELQDNNLLSKETMNKYFELQKLFSEMSNDEMKKAMEQMQNLLKNMDRKQIQQSLENMKLDEEAFRKSLERTINLLNRIKVQQKLDEVIKRNESISEKQENLEKELEQKNLSDEKERNELSKQNEEQTKSLEKLEEELKDLQKKMEKLKDMPKEELEKLREEFEKQQNSELSEQSSEQIKKQQKSEAQKTQSQLKKNIQKNKKSLENLQQSMQRQNEVKTFTEMLKILDNIISLSKEQENLAKKNNFNSNKNENARDQEGIKRNLESIFKQMNQLAQKTFAVTPEMGKSLGDAHRRMDQAQQDLQENNSSNATMNQNQAMKSLNDAASMMKNQMENMMQGGEGGSGMMSLMQQLQQLSQQQMGLNSLTQMLQQAMKQGGLSPEQQSQLQRISQEQEMIRKSIDQLNREAMESGKSKTLTQNLEEINRQLREVVTNMKTEKLSDELIQKQEKILSKLLDAQRSINERDFEQKREGRTGQNVVGDTPAELNFDKLRGRENLRDLLNRAIQEGFTKDYEDLIRKYYEAVQNKIINN